MDRSRQTLGAGLTGAVVVGATIIALVGLRLPELHASDVASPAPLDSFPPPEPSLPPIVQTQLDALPAGTKIVDCLPGIPRMPAGLIVNRTLGFYQQRPAFVELAEGYCADDPNATPMPMRMDSADGPP